ncbi:hypothetical protein GLAREA_12448 [Glarea lozoyensis ATCC 20868]|uniref:Inositol-pentakisphosphate 2-kinase n=1 Tax=Glarea lozoyensis (strain ATCC 20868 / MF5171) TaxID=1116229 RepID=S3CZK1_GLAL2|nr:uncharacterized protein GLAREA_12448 [Glarea lozoyensis ATCC 20868]EPE31692.1 hypothetical protein GLAREA_12448 [Glarea lozoyensis ATCC 20868]
MAPPTTEESDIPVLPVSTEISYLSEGAANIVYRISVPLSTPPPSEIEEFRDGTPPPSEIEVFENGGDLRIFDKKLLRLRKNLPTTLPCSLSQQNWERLLVPLFHADNLVKQTLVDLRPSNIISRLNSELRTWEQQPHPNRPSKRHGTYLAPDPYGLLVVDMTPSPTTQLLEFKPKWLLQSPSAPPKSIRCRQCARHAQLTSLSPSNPPPPTFCPLDLIHSPSRAVPFITSDPVLAAHLTKWLQPSPLLTQLRDAQKAMDPFGALGDEATGEKFCLAMTLRDCTVFLRLKGGEGEVEARLGDLDLKSAEKVGYWREVERGLVDGGWYEGTEKAGRKGDVLCAVGRGIK